MNYSYEEIRKIAIQVLFKGDGWSGQYDIFKNAVASALRQEEQPLQQTGLRQVWSYSSSLDSSLPLPEANLLLEIFWNFFREGIITLGINDLNKEFPWFRLSEYGKRLLKNQDPYFFLDISDYESIIQTEIPQIDSTTLIYLKEAMQAFMTGCLLSCSVMLGVATEYSFLKLLEIIENNPRHSNTYTRALNERMILRKLNAFKSTLDQNQSVLTSREKEDLDTNFAGIMSIIRNFRNDSGHPSGKIISREQCYVLLQLFIPYCKKIYQLIEVFVVP